MAAADAFHALVSGSEYPMFVVTAADGDTRAGCLVGFATQASIAPPRLLVAISKVNHTYQVARRAPILAVHFLRRGDDHLAALFGSETGDDVDKLARCRWSPGPGGVPILDGTRGWVAGRVLERFDFGDHIGHLLDVAAAEVADEGPQLGFHAVEGLEPGHPA